MQRDDIVKLYDKEYAEHYNERFLLGSPYRQTTDHEVSLLEGLLQQSANWLDVGCGTGYYLSRFPDIIRCGLDLSPAMLEVAKRNNPDAEFVLGDFLIPRPEWCNQWHLVTCMWQAYSYVDTLDEVVRLIENLASWTAQDGTCFFPITDVEALCGHDIPFRRRLDTSDGTLQIDAVMWSCLEPSGLSHVSLIAPHKDLLVEEFSKYFYNVEIVDYPHLHQDVVESRPRALIAKKRIPNSTTNE
jgi:SAM-dependent methyltransferase